MRESVTHVDDILEGTLSQNSACLTFFIDLQLQDVADLGEDVVREGGQQGDTLQEVQLVLHLLDAGSLHQSEVSIQVTVTNQRSVFRSQ